MLCTILTCTQQSINIKVYDEKSSKVYEKEGELTLSTTNNELKITRDFSRGIEIDGLETGGLFKKGIMVDISLSKKDPIFFGVLFSHAIFIILLNYEEYHLLNHPSSFVQQGLPFSILSQCWHSRYAVT